MARQGKVARLPHALRQEVNRRLLNGDTARSIVEWLNDHDDAKQTLDTYFHGQPFNPQNISEWRSGGYRDWLKKKEKVENLKTLASFSLDLAKAGGSISEGAAAIAAGEILQTLENVASDEDADLSKLTSAIVSLRQADLARDRLNLDKQKHTTKEKEVALAREKFETQTAEQFLKWAKSKEAQKILDSGKSKSVQTAKLRELMFGKRK